MGMICSGFFAIVWRSPDHLFCRLVRLIARSIGQDHGPEQNNMHVASVSHHFRGTNSNHMRTPTTFSALVCTLALSAQWTAVSSGTSTMLEAVHRIDAQQILTSGKDGVLRRSSDGGASWQALASDYTDDINAILQLDEQHFLLCADGGTVIRSSDGGYTWDAENTPTNSELVDADQWNEVFIAVGENGVMLRSTDNGGSWSMLASGTTNDLQAVRAISDQRWFTVGKNGTALLSTDGGFFWSSIDMPTTADLNDVLFLDGQVGWICGDEGELYQTSDGGLQWTSMTSGTGLELNALCNNASVLYVCGRGGSVRTSSNGGATWNAMTTPVTTELRDILVDDDGGVAVGDQGTVIRLGAGTTAIQVHKADRPIMCSTMDNGAALLLTVSESWLSRPMILSFLDAQGRTVRAVEMLHRTTVINDLPTGWYILHVSVHGQLEQAQPVVIVK